MDGMGGGVLIDEGYEGQLDPNIQYCTLYICCEFRSTDFLAQNVSFL